MTCTYVYVFRTSLWCTSQYTRPALYSSRIFRRAGFSGCQQLNPAGQWPELSHAVAAYAAGGSKIAVTAAAALPVGIATRWDYRIGNCHHNYITIKESFGSISTLAISSTQLQFKSMARDSEVADRRGVSQPRRSQRYRRPMDLQAAYSGVQNLRDDLVSLRPYWAPPLPREGVELVGEVAGSAQADLHMQLSPHTARTPSVIINKSNNMHMQISPPSHTARGPQLPTSPQTQSINGTAMVNERDEGGEGGSEHVLEGTPPRNSTRTSKTSASSSSVGTRTGTNSSPSSSEQHSQHSQGPGTIDASEVPDGQRTEEEPVPRGLHWSVKRRRSTRKRRANTDRDCEMEATEGTPGTQARQSAFMRRSMGWPCHRKLPAGQVPSEGAIRTPPPPFPPSHVGIASLTILQYARVFHILYHAQLAG